MHGDNIQFMRHDSEFSMVQILAAHRYGIKRVILPERNMKDLVEVPSAVLANLEVSLYQLPCRPHLVIHRYLLNKMRRKCLRGNSFLASHPPY